MKTWFSIAFAVCGLWVIGFAQTVPNMINYQGRLTDQGGVPLAAGTYGIQFRLWDTPTGSNTLVWAQQQDVAVQANGTFNVILGAPGGSQIQGSTPAVNDLTFAFASSNRFLGITMVISNGIAVASPGEIVPRQQILTVPFSFTAASVIPGAIGTQQIAKGAVGAAQLAPSGVQTANLAIGSVTMSNLAPRQVGTNVGVGGIAISPLISTTLGYVGPPPGRVVPGMAVTLVTTGRPVMVMLSGSATNDLSFVRSYLSSGTTLFYQFELLFLRNGLQTSGQMLYVYGTSGSWDARFPPSQFQFLDLPPAGTNTYSVSIETGGAPGNLGVGLNAVQLVAFEL